MSIRKQRTQKFQQEQAFQFFIGMTQQMFTVNENIDKDNYIDEIDFMLEEFTFLNLDIIVYIVENYTLNPDFWWNISNNQMFDISWYEKYPDKPWRLNNIAFSDKFDISWCIKHPDLDWDWYEISCCKNFKLKWIQNHSDLPWNWINIATNQKLEIEWLEILAQQDNLEEIWSKLSDHPNLKLEWLEKYATYPWNWNYISENINLRLSWLKKFPDRIWNWVEISKHPYCEYEWYLSFPKQSWRLEELFINRNFTQSYFQYQSRKYMAAYKIQGWWRKIIYNPHTKVGKKFVNKLYDTAFTN